jgi:hypothetical protein
MGTGRMTAGLLAGLVTMLGICSVAADDRTTTYTALDFAQPDRLPIVRTFAWPHAPVAEFGLVDGVSGGGDHCGKIMYHFFLPDEDEEAGIQVARRLAGVPSEVTCRVRGDGSGYRLTLTLFDRTDERFGFSLGRLDFDGWRELSGQVTKPLYHMMGNNDGVIDYPVTIGRITVSEAGVKGGPGNGGIELDRVSVTTRVDARIAVIGVRATAPGALFGPGSPPAFAIELLNSSDGRASTGLWWRALGERQVPAARGTLAVALAAGERREVVAKLPALAPGWYTLEVGTGEEWEPQWTTAFGVLRITADATQRPDSPMGVNIHGGGMTRGDLARLFGIAKRAGADWIRFWQFEASRVWIARGNDGFGEYDDVVAAGQEAGVQLLPIVSWQYAYLPDNPHRFGDWLGALVRRYRPGGELARERGWTDGYGVSAWEVINEPNIQPDYFRGTVDDYRNLLRLAGNSARREDPSCRIVLGGMAYGDEKYMLQVVGTDGAGLFDVANQHYYRSPLAPELGTYLPDLARCRAAVEGFAPGRPIWITETSYPTEPNRQAHAGVPPEVQARFLARMYLLVLAQEPRAKVFWYPLTGSYGFFNEDFTPKPAALAYRTIADELASARYIGALDAGKEAYVLVFGRQGQQVIAAWRLPDVRVQATLKDGQPVGLSGEVTLADLGQEFEGYVSHINSVPTLFADAWRPRATELEVGAERIEQVDLMARTRVLQCHDRRLRLDLNDSPIFLHGASVTFP